MGKMKTAEAIKTLQWYNQWRQGSDINPPKPKDITAAIEKAIEVMKLNLKTK